MTTANGKDIKAELSAATPLAPVSSSSTAPSTSTTSNVAVPSANPQASAVRNETSSASITSQQSESLSKIPTTAMTASTTGIPADRPRTVPSGDKVLGNNSSSDLSSSTAANLFVTNIPGGISKEYFEKLIEPYAQNGRVIEIKFFKRVVEESCYAFIHLESAIDGEKCMKDLNRRILNGHTMRVGPASKRDPLLSQTNLYIEGVPREWTDNDLRKHFSEFGEIAAARILVDKDTQTSREVGFVHYTNHEDALSAMETLQDEKAYAEAPRTFKIKFANKVRKKDEFAMELYRERGRFGSDRYYHESEMNTPRFNEQCRYWQRGGCLRGKDCFYQHGNASIQPQSSSHGGHPGHRPPHPGHPPALPYGHHPMGHPPHSYAPSHPGHHPQSHHGHRPAIPPPHPHPAPHPTAHPTYDPYAAAYAHSAANGASSAATSASAGTYPHSAYYAQYYGTTPTAPVASAAANGHPYYQQPYAGYPGYPQYAAAAGTQQATQQQQQQAQGQAQNKGAVAPAKGVKAVPISSEEQKTNPSNGANASAAAATAANAKSAATNGTVQPGAVQQTATWYPPVAAPTNVTAMQPGYVNPGYGASRQPGTAATDARWDPYKAQMAAQAHRGYLPPTARQ